MLLNFSIPVRTRKKIFSLVLIFTAAWSVLLCSNQAFSQCNQKQNVGEIFYNFDKIIVYYGQFPRYGNKIRAGYPKILEYKNFTHLLTETLRENFGACLKTETGFPKEIAVIPPLVIQNSYGGIRDNNVDQIHNPRNLTIVVSLIYEPGHIATLGVEEYGQFTYFFYRPEIAYKMGRLPLSNNSGAFTFFPQQGEEKLKEKFLDFFASIRPIQDVAPPGVQIQPTSSSHE